jgi:hypothetical protein
MHHTMATPFALPPARSSEGTNEGAQVERRRHPIRSPLPAPRGRRRAAHAPHPAPRPAAAAGFGISSAGADAVAREFHEALARSSDMAVAVAAIQALTTVIRSSRAQTMMGLGKEVQAAAASLQRGNPTAISLKAGCELFLRYTTRTSAVDSDDFDEAKNKLIERGRHFAGAPLRRRRQLECPASLRAPCCRACARLLAPRLTVCALFRHPAETSKRARATIAEQGERFIRPGFTVLCHGHSRVVLAILRKAAATVRWHRVQDASLPGRRNCCPCNPAPCM